MCLIRPKTPAGRQSSDAVNAARETRAKRVLITGATGNIGATTLTALQGSDVETIAGLSRTSRQEELPAGFDYRVCEFSNAQEVADALHGVDAAMLLIPFDEDMVTYGERFVEAARNAGLRFILRISALAADTDSPSLMGQLHGQIDAAVRASGIPFCILRCNSFMQNFSGHYRSMICKANTLRLPEDAASSCFIDTADIAQVAANILRQPETHLQRIYDLDGPEALSNADIAEEISAVTGRHIVYQPIFAEEARRSYQKFGISSWKIDVLDSLSRFIREGNGAHRHPALEELLMRPANTFRQFAEAHRECWMPR